MGTAVAPRRRSDANEFTGRQKVAILLMAMGEENSAEITKNLDPEEVEAISFEIARLRDVTPDQVQQVVEEWQTSETAAFSLAKGGVDFARKVLEKAFGPVKAQQVLKRIEAQLNDFASLNHLRKADPQQLAAMIRNEHPQLLALVLAYLEPGQTAAVLREIEERKRGEVLMRIATMEKVLPEILEIIQESLGSESDLSLSGDGSSRAGGPEAVAEVLNLVTTGMERELLDEMTDRDPELSEHIKSLMFVFEDIIKLDDKGITRLLRDVETRDLAMALKMASDELKDRMLSSMSSRAKDALIEEMEFLGPQRVSDVEQAQAGVVQTARALEEAGEIVIGGGNEVLVD